MKIEKGSVIYYLDRNASNNPELLFSKMDIVEKKDETFKEGGLYAHSKEGHWTREFRIDEETVKKLTNPKYPCIFESKEAAQEQYNKELQRKVDNILNMQQEDLVKQLFSSWRGEFDMDIKIHDAMVEKIKKEFGVEV